LPFGDGHDEAVGVAAARRAFLDDRIEPAHDHALAVEGHVLAHLLHARIVHELLVRGVAFLPRRIFEPGEDDLLIGLGVDRFTKVGDLALWDVAVPRFDHPADADVLDERGKLGRVLPVGVLIRFGHGHDESLEIGHATAPSGSGWCSRNTASWSDKACWNAGRASARFTK